MIRRITPELVLLVIGLVTLSVGLGARYGWDMAAVVLGALSVMLSAWSAAWSDRGR